MRISMDFFVTPRDYDNNFPQLFKFLGQFCEGFLKWGLAKYNELYSSGSFFDPPIPIDWIPGIEKAVRDIECGAFPTMREFKSFGYYLDNYEIRLMFPFRENRCSLTEQQLVENITKYFYLSVRGSRNNYSAYTLNGYLCNISRYPENRISFADVLALSATKIFSNNSKLGNNGFEFYRTQLINDLTTDPTRFKRVILAFSILFRYLGFDSKTKEIDYDKMVEQMFNNDYSSPNIIRTGQYFISLCNMALNGSKSIEEVVDLFLIEMFIKLLDFPKFSYLHKILTEYSITSFSYTYDYYIPIVQLLYLPYKLNSFNDIKEKCLDPNMTPAHANHIQDLFQHLISNASTADRNSILVGTRAYYYIDKLMLEDNEICIDKIFSSNYDVLSIISKKIDAVRQLCGLFKLLTYTDSHRVIRGVLDTILGKNPEFKSSRCEISDDHIRIIDIISEKFSIPNFKDFILKIKEIRQNTSCSISLDTLLLQTSIPVEGIWKREDIPPEVENKCIVLKDTSKLLKPKEHIDQLVNLGFKLPKCTTIHVNFVTGSIPPGWKVFIHKQSNDYLYELDSLYSSFPDGMYLIDEHNKIRASYSIRNCDNRQIRPSIIMFPRYYILNNDTIFDLKECNVVEIIPSKCVSGELETRYTVSDLKIAALARIKELFPDIYTDGQIKWWSYW